MEYKQLMVTSSFGVSIGTGLMLESVFKPTEKRYDEDRVIPDKVNLNDYDVYYFNARTLLRNIYSSFDKITKENILKNRKVIDILEELLRDEMSIIENLFTDEKIKFSFYFPFYDKIEDSLDNSIKVLNGKSLIENYYDAVCKKFTKDRMFKFDKSNEKALITTHTALDLLNFKQFNSLTLLESYTGKLKTKSMFNTKFNKYSNHDLSNIPFVEQFVYIFGDGSYIKPFPSKYRKLLLEISEAKKWHASTSTDKIKNDLAKKDLELFEIFRTFKIKY